MRSSSSRACVGLAHALPSAPYCQCFAKQINIWWQIVDKWLRNKDNIYLVRVLWSGLAYRTLKGSTNFTLHVTKTPWESKQLGELKALLVGHWSETLHLYGAGPAWFQASIKDTKILLNRCDIDVRAPVVAEHHWSRGNRQGSALTRRACGGWASKLVVATFLPFKSSAALRSFLFSGEAFTETILF